MRIKVLLLVMLSFLASVTAEAQDAENGTAISLETADGVLQGTLLAPDSRKPVPVVLLLSGSGPTDRDGNNPMARNNSLKMLAQGLYENGIASVRFDKRGVAESKGALLAEQDLRFDHYVQDATLWLQKLNKDKRFSKVVVLGHSEGSLIGMLAAEKTKADGFISVAGAGQAAGKMIRKQL